MFNRFNGNVVPFASDATGTNRTIFGDVTQSDDIDDNLNADFKSGWEIVGVNDNPTKQDFNALAFTISNLVAYLYQQGVAVWNTSQEYFVNSYVVGSDGKLYRAKTGTSGTPNQGNDPTTDSVNWESLDGKFVDLLNAQTIAGIKTFSSFPITPSSAPTTNYQVANKKFVDDSIAATIGIGQTWQNVTGSRASSDITGSTNIYTNTTGAPIQVLVSGSYAVNTGIKAWVDGVQIVESFPSVSTETAQAISGAFIVPSGSTYAVYAKNGLYIWAELR